MKIIIIAFFSVIFVVNPVLASDRCKEKAQAALELREDYKSLAEFQRYYLEASTNIRLFNQLGGATAKSEMELELKRLLAIEVFQIHKGAQGVNLQRQVLSSCVALEKSDAERAARQAERAARQAARDAAKAEKGTLESSSLLVSEPPTDEGSSGSRKGVR
jgi:hypothetical protein